MSDPYGSNSGSNPYGGYGYGTPAPGTPQARTDGISIAAFVCALTCCAGPVGVGLGIAGIVRTKDGRRRGRWAAVTGLVLGAIGTVALIATLASLVVAFNNTVLEQDAEVGQCVNTGFLGTESDNLWEASCSEDHDAEIIYVDVATADVEAQYDAGDSIEDICGPLAGDGYAQVLADDTYRVKFASDSFDDDITEGDWLVCYVERTDGEQLDAPLPRGSTP